MNDQLITMYKTVEAFSVHAWETVATQVYISTIVHLVISSALTFGMVALSRYVYLKGTIIPEGYSYPALEKDEKIMLLTICAVLGLLIVFPYVMHSLYCLVTLWINPEYLIIEQISTLIR